jgi:hypothetical protein
MNQDTWVLQCDWVKRIIKNGLDKYQTVIHPFFFKEHESIMGRTRTAAWYLKRIPLDAIAYLYAGREVKSILEATERQINLKLDCKEADFTDAKIEEQLRELVKDVLSLAKSKVSKYVGLMDPKYGNFMDKAAEMHAKMPRRKHNNEAKLIELTPDRAWLFTAVNMDPQLCMDLLKVHCLVEKRKDWFHPLTSLDMDQSVKQWLFTWNMWLMVEGVTEAMLPVIIQEVYEEVKEQELEKKQAELMDMFQAYCKEVKTLYLNFVWYNPYGAGARRVSKEVLCNRAKQYVFRFVNHIKQKKLPYFPLYPGCF